MSPSVKRGLQLAKDLLRKWQLTAPFGESTDGVRRSDVDAAIQWIAQQEKIDDKRRGPRRLNPPGAKMQRTRSGL